MSTVKYIYSLGIMFVLFTHSAYGKHDPLVWAARCTTSGQEPQKIKEDLLEKLAHPMEVHIVKGGNKEMRCEADEDLVGALVRQSEEGTMRSLGYLPLARDPYLNSERVH